MHVVGPVLDGVGVGVTGRSARSRGATIRTLVGPSDPLLRYGEIGGGGVVIGSLGIVGVCDQRSRLICDRLAWLVWGSVVGSLWNDWRASIAICSWVILYRINVHRRDMVDRNLLYFLAEASGN